MHRHLLAEILDFVLRHRRRNQRRPDRTRGDRIDPNALRRQHLGKPAGKVLNGALGRGIGQQGRIRHVGVHRRGVDDRRSRAHVRDCGLGEIEHGVNVGLERPLPFLVADISDLLERVLMGRVVDENVDSPNASTVRWMIARQ